ncbi:cation transporter [Candidatus Saccharibacteria bacterium]|nr:cation transporter [Candidatus Saccharibacteria bacterium]
MERAKKIIRISILGIIVNLILVAFKAVVGFVTNSIAIVLDAVNNLSDALSSIITIVGAKISAKRPDKKHPFGHGRVEYFSSIIIAIIVLAAGLTSLKESFEKVINPEMAEYSITSLVIIIVAVFVKFFFGRYVRAQGKKLNSGSLVASGTDALSDAVLSFSTFVGALVSFFWHISLEGYLGLVISLVIIKTAIEILRETVDHLIGVRADKKLTTKIKKAISSNENVLGVYDLAVHNYGPNKIIASAHIQLDDNLNVRDVHRLTRRIEVDIYNKFGIILTLGVYASNDTGEFKEMRNYIFDLAKKYKNIIEIHGFYVDEEFKEVSFDLIFNFDEEKPEKCVEEIKKTLKQKYPDFNFSIILDADISD